MGTSRARCHRAQPKQEEQSGCEQSPKPDGRLQAGATKPHLLPGQQHRLPGGQCFTKPSREQTKGTVRVECSVACLEATLLGARPPCAEHSCALRALGPHGPRCLTTCRRITPSARGYLATQAQGPGHTRAIRS